MERNLSKPTVVNSYPGNGIMLLELNRRHRMTAQMQDLPQRALGWPPVTLFPSSETLRLHWEPNSEK